MLALEVIFLALFWCWVFSAILFLRNTMVPRLPISVTPEQLGMASETVQFTATDGVRLEGWKVAGDAARPWIIICHGVGANRSDLLEMGARLHQAGFNLFLFDFRGHGGSAGSATSFGWLEQRDLEGALAFLGSQSDVAARPYGVYAASMGAVTALSVAARDERLGALAVDSPFTALDESIGRHLALMYPALPKAPFLWFVLATYRLRFGVWPGSISSVQAARRLGERPLLVINGKGDDRMPPEGARAIVDAAEDGSAELWLVEGAAHLESYGVQQEAYSRRVADFFTRHLSGGK